MNRKPTYEELEQISRKLEKEIEGRKKAEEAMQESEEMYRDLYDNAPNAHFSVSSEDGSILRCNNAALNLLGYDRAALKRMKVFDLYADTPHGISKAQKVFKCFQKGESIRDVELQMRHKDGYPIWVSLSVEPVKDHNGNIIESRSMVIDISERKRTAIEIRCLKEKYEDLYNNAPIMYLSLNINGIIIECNNAILDKLGYPKREIIGKHITTFLTEESVASFRKDFPELLKTGKILGVERQLIIKSGEIVDVQVSVSGEYDEHGKLIKTRASFEDISGLKRAEKHIHSLTHALINAHESERQMISRELHDRIAQDLSTLKLNFENLFDNQTTVSSEISQKVSELSEKFRKAIVTVRDLSYDLRPPLLEEMGLVETISHFCEDFSEEHSLNIHFNTAGMDNLRLNFEMEINLYRLIQESLNNIRKHAAATDAFVKLIAASPNIILRIEDNGQGFDVEHRLEAATNEKRMGLRSMEERTCLLGGEMAVESLPLKGTKILITIPQKKGKNGTKKNDTDR